jgi:predicted nuclease of predicted toxin-antitoxin system
LKILVDECVPGAVAQALAAAGHEITLVAEVSRSAEDDDVLRLAIQLGLPLLTVDVGFGDLVQNREHPGLILLRLERLSAARKADRAVAAFRRHGESFNANVSVISPGQVRVRRP